MDKKKKRITSANLSLHPEISCLKEKLKTEKVSSNNSLSNTV